jgi:hypothetical protein
MTKLELDHSIYHSKPNRWRCTVCERHYELEARSDEICSFRMLSIGLTLERLHLHFQAIFFIEKLKYDNNQALVDQIRNLFTVMMIVEIKQISIFSFFFFGILFIKSIKVCKNSSRYTKTVRKFSLVGDQTSDLLLAWLTRKPLAYTGFYSYAKMIGKLYMNRV